MKPSTSQRLNWLNFVEIQRLCAGVEIIPFYGTLLGLTRDGAVIPGDDDIDFLVRRSSRDQLIELLANSPFSVDFGDPGNATPHFLQATRMQEGERTLVDLYFYDYDPSSGQFVDRWNFHGLPLKPENAIHLPKNLIFPLREITLDGIRFKVPAQMEGCCAYLYGPRWREPLRKSVDYRTAIAENRPKIFYPTPEFLALEKDNVALKRAARSLLVHLAAVHCEAGIASAYEGPALTRVDHRWDGELGVVAFQTPTPDGASPAFLVRIVQAETEALSVGLHVPIWALGEPLARRIEEETKALGLLWGGEPARALGGWVEIVDPSAPPPVSVTLAEAEADPRACRHIAAGAAALAPTYRRVAALFDL